MINQESQSRTLPELNIAGTLFTVDARLNEFRQKDAPWNRISMDDIAEEGELSGFLFDKNTKQVYNGEADPDNLPGHICLAIIPPIIELDPVGLARRFGLADHDLIPTSKEHQKPAKVTPLAKDLTKNNQRKKGRRI